MSSGGGRLKSRPWDAIKSVFQSPNWVNNVLWLSIGALLQSVFVGQIAIFGYGTDLLRARSGLPDTPNIDVNSDRIGDYISQGVWPFLVNFVLQLIVTFVGGIPILLIVITGLGVGGAFMGDAGAAFGILAVSPIVIIFSIVAGVVVIPFTLRAMLCQDFAKAFDLAWAKGFLHIMFKEIIVSGFFFMLQAYAVIFLGLLCCGVGIFPATGIVWGGAMKLLAQWYEIYLDRGGEPVELPDEPIVEATIV